MFNKLKQFKDLRTKAKDLKAKLSLIEVEGSASFGKVKIVINGAQEILSVTIDPQFLQPSNKEKVEGAIKDAFADAMKKISRKMASQMSSLDDFQFPDLGNN